MEFECEFCKKTFSSKHVLTTHLNTAKYCLQIQGKTNNNIFECDFCTKMFSTNQRLQEHKSKACKEKKQKDNEDKNLKHIEEIKKVKNELRKKEKEYKEKLAEKDSYILELKTKLEKFENAVISSKSITNTTTTTTNNIVVNSNTLNLDDKEKLKALIEEKLTPNFVCQGQRGLAKFTYDNLLTDENGNLKYKCVDSSRQNFEFTNSNGIIERDVKASKLKQALLDSNVMRQAGVVGEKVWTKEDGTIDNERFEVFNTKVLEIVTVDKDDTKFRSELSVLTSQ
jgi:hypothetical protein